VLSCVGAGRRVAGGSCFGPFAGRLRGDEEDIQVVVRTERPLKGNREKWAEKLCVENLCEVV